MAWLFLLVAGLCETVWAIGLKYTEGFSRLLPTIGTTMLGIYLFNEPATLLRLACIGLVLSGIIGLKISS